MANPPDDTEKKLQLLKDSLDSGIIDQTEYEKSKTALVQSSIQEKQDTQKDKPSSDSPEKKEEKKPEKQESNSVEIYTVEEEKSSRSFLWIIGLVLITLLLSFCALQPNDSDSTTPANFSLSNPLLAATIECHEDRDCTQEGMESYCDEPGTPDAECVVQPAIPIQLQVLSSQDCQGCDPSRMNAILSRWFPALGVQQVDVGSEEGKNLIEEHDITLLPAYVLNGSVQDSLLYDKSKNIFRESNDAFVVKESASGSSFVVHSIERPNTLNVFLSGDDPSSLRALVNLQPFVDAFAQTEVEVHFSSSHAGVLACVAQHRSVSTLIEFASCLYQEGGCTEFVDETITDCVANNADALTSQSKQAQDSLYISSLPTFVVNNKELFSGVQPAQTIKEKYCARNQDLGCDQDLNTHLL